MISLSPFGKGMVSGAVQPDPGYRKIMRQRPIWPGLGFSVCIELEGHRVTSPRRNELGSTFRDNEPRSETRRTASLTASRGPPAHARDGAYLARLKTQQKYHCIGTGAARRRAPSGIGALRGVAAAGRQR